MVPQTTKTIAPRAFVTYSTVAPLTTIFTPPITCSTAALTIFGGSCSGVYCTAYSPDQITRSWYAAVNYVYWNSLSQMVGNWETACAPPGSQLVEGFYFSPAVGCPVGYTTATSVYSSDYGSFVSYISRGNSMSAICCPSAYSSVEKLSAGDWGCYSTMSKPGQSMIVVAYGRSTSYDTYGATFYYNSISTISTTTINALPTGTATHLWVYAAAVAMVVPTGTVTSLAASTAYGATTTPAFHLGPLSMTISIVIVVVGGIAVLLIIGAFCIFCRRRPYRPPPRSYPSILESPISFQQYQPPRPVYPAPTTWANPPAANQPLNDSIAGRTAALRRVREENNARSLALAEAREKAEKEGRERLETEEQAKKEHEEDVRKEKERKLEAEMRAKRRKERNERSKKKGQEAEALERFKAEQERKTAEIKRDPARLYRLKVTWETPTPNYENIFDEGPNYGAAFFKVDGKTSLSGRKQPSEKRRLTGLAFPFEQADSQVCPTSRLVASPTPSPKTANERFPYNGPKLQVKPGGTTLNASPACAPQPATSASESNPVPLSPRKPAPSTQTPVTSPTREDTGGRNSRNKLPKDGPKFVVKVGGDTLEDIEDSPKTGAASGSAPNNLAEALSEIFGSRKR